ncbi:hypothetical protein AvCA_26170 [Azotobacter vinelandii CA]|uniref:Uncharacterized protein n=2 Tax=Azotobacter vinelandii TaxID=354 RepID=C1DJM4_AZOVD|nr:hypothetical protein Avin_26170 [Azotobacter vinelandii DJ]AGK16605.1 hypothetical protein AvCA_26170 [Azotobacter vinelandii CA]AGK20751.1 hypothetical protein AvCA6_26170 [Azotobacter vinelandii CA6]
MARQRGASSSPGPGRGEKHGSIHERRRGRGR